MAVRIVKHTMDIIHLLSDQNPIQVIVDAIINSGPVRRHPRRFRGCHPPPGGRYVSLRRVNQAIWLITTGAREASFRSEDHRGVPGG